MDLHFGLQRRKGATISLVWYELAPSLRRSFQAFTLLIGCQEVLARKLVYHAPEPTYARTTLTCSICTPYSPQYIRTSSSSLRRRRCRSVCTVRPPCRCSIGLPTRPTKPEAPEHPAHSKVRSVPGRLKAIERRPRIEPHRSWGPTRRRDTRVEVDHVPYLQDQAHTRFKTPTYASDHTPQAQAMQHLEADNAALASKHNPLWALSVHRTSVHRTMTVRPVGQLTSLPHLSTIQSCLSKGGA